MGEIIEFNGGEKTYKGYLAKSATGSGPGVIVLQEWWGLVGHIKDVADRFAQEGFTALAPDLYEGKTAEEPDEAGSLMMALNIENTEKILRKAIDALLANDATTGDKVGVVGFCMGGQLSMFAAASNPDRVGACVNYYGIHPNVKPAFENLQAPIMGFFAENDDYASSEAVIALGQQLASLDKAHEFNTYPGTAHAFFNNERPSYNQEASEDTWRRMIAFFKENLS